MSSFQIKKALHIRGEVSLPGDKSIAHRSIILAAISRGEVKVKNFPANQDCLSTIKAFKKLGIKISFSSPDKLVSIKGAGLYGLNKPKGPIFLGDSGTSLRLILGVLSGQEFSAKLTAGKSLSKRPMRRVTEPLRKMGAIINAACSLKPAAFEEYPPITIRGGELKAITYKMPVASAQVKSALLLAGLYACGVTKVIEPIPSRDHTERMLKLFKADIEVKKNSIKIKGKKELVSPSTIIIPADISSVAFFIVAACILPNSKILIKNVGLNPTRTGILGVLERMQADIKTYNKRPTTYGLEPAGDLIIKSSRLKGTIVRKEEIPSLIDELPILMVAACFAKSKTIFEGVGELRVKETDRIRSMVENLGRMGAKINVVKAAKLENIVIEGVKKLQGAEVRSFGDHRTAMSLIIAGLIALGKTTIDDISCINKSFPDFLKILKPLLR